MEEGSEVKEYYPEEFEVDLNGKKFAWQGVALLPFIDEKRLLGALEPFYDRLTDAEKRRNALGYEVLYVGRGVFLDTVWKVYKFTVEEVRWRSFFSW